MGIKKASEVNDARMKEIKEIYDTHYGKAIATALNEKDMQRVCQLIYDYTEDLIEYDIHILLSRR